jgi:DMSO/TMAO reductase YedYZ molybdopterin-dependent catalytic subunit
MSSVNRRTFMALAGMGLPLSVRRLMGEHHVLSVDPLMVDFDISSLQGRYTAEQDFYVRDHGEVPQAPLASALRIEGEVAQPVEVTLAQLASLERRKLGAVLECAGNPVKTIGKVSNGVWEGWSLGDVLALAHPARTGTYLNLFGRDGYVRSVPIDRAYNDGMLVTHLNGQRLTRNHGAPWRALFPGWYGMDAVKWLERIVVSKTELPTNQTAYVELTQGPSGEIETRPLPPIQVKSLILSPENRAVLHPGKVITRGIAWSGAAKIAKVEVSADGGISWQSATLDCGGRYEWALWQSELNLNRPGAADLICRAVDEQGHGQAAERDPRRLDGYVNNWCHHISCVVV